MSKKMLKRSLVLGALMAFVITGSAMAAQIDNAATGQNAIAIGHNSVEASTADAIAIGNGAKAKTEAAAIAMGYIAESTGNASIAVGREAKATTSSATAIGDKAEASGTYSNAIGVGATASGTDGIAFGTNSKAEATYSTAIGYGAQATAHSAVAIGERVTAGYLGVAIGQGAVADTGGNDVAVAIGQQASATADGAIAVGRFASASGNSSVAFGASTIADAQRTTAIGYEAQATNRSDVALGSHAITETVHSVVNPTVGGNTYNVAGISNDDSFVAAASFGGGKSGTASDNKTIYRQLQYVAAGKVDATSTDAVNGSQLYAAYQAIDATQTSANAAVAGINQRLDRTNAKINKVGAGAAALAALHPLDYDPDDKLTFSAGMGNYAGENAAALGAFYRPNEKFMVSLGGTMGNGENMVNLGLSIGLDKPNGLAKLSKRELIQKVNAVEAENDALEDRVAKLEALVAQLASK